MSTDMDMEGIEAADSVLSDLIEVYVECGEAVPSDIYQAHEWVQDMREAHYE